MKIVVYNYREFDEGKYFDRFGKLYNVEIINQPLPYQYIRWVKEGCDLSSLNLSSDTKKVQDLKGQHLLLFTNEWGVRWASEKNSGLELLEFSKN